MLNAYYKEYRTFVNNELAGTEGSVIQKRKKKRLKSTGIMLVQSIPSMGF